MPGKRTWPELILEEWTFYVATWGLDEPQLSLGGHF